MQKRRHLEASFQQTDPGCSSDSQPHAFLISGPASPGNKKLYFFKPYFMCNVVKVSERRKDANAHSDLKNLFFSKIKKIMLVIILISTWIPSNQTATFISSPKA